MRPGKETQDLSLRRRSLPAGGTEAPRVTEALRRNLPEYIALGRGVVRPDVRVLHDFYLFQVKRPGESTGPWDDDWLVRRMPAAEAFRPLAAGGCLLAVQ